MQSYMLFSQVFDLAFRIIVQEAVPVEQQWQLWISLHVWL